MPVYKLKSFARFARSEAIADESLVEAVGRVTRGLIDADLGGGLIKQRVARKGQRRSGGFRLMIAFRVGDFAVFLFGFAKSAEANLDDRQITLLRGVAASWLSADAATIIRAVEQGELVKVLK